MNASDLLLNLPRLARRLGVPAKFLRTEADAGRIPCIRAGSRFLFDPNAVERALARQASGNESSAPPALSRHGLALALAGPMLQARASCESFADLTAWASSVDLGGLDAAFERGDRLLVFDARGLVFGGLVSAERRDRELGKGAAVLSIDVAGIVRLLREKLAAKGGRP
jgi:hypothetical protein